MSDSAVQFRKILGRRDVLAIAFGAMVGWSWVVLAGEMIVRAGTLGSILAFAAGAVMVWLVGLTYAELTAALSRAGGEISFTFVGLGPLGAFVCGWTLVLAYVAVCAFEAVALPTVVSYLVPGFEVVYLYTVAGWDVHLSWVLVGVGGALATGLVNYFGIRFAAFAQTVAAGGLLLVDPAQDRLEGFAVLHPGGGEAKSELYRWAFFIIVRRVIRQSFAEFAARWFGSFRDGTGWQKGCRAGSLHRRDGRSSPPPP